MIERNAAAQARLIDDMLDMARIISGKLRLDMRPVDLVDGRAGGDRRGRAGGRGQAASRCETQLDAEPPRDAAATPDRLQQVVWNLLSNAVKFTEPGGHDRAGDRARRPERRA